MFLLQGLLDGYYIQCIYNYNEMRKQQVCRLGVCIVESHLISNLDPWFSAGEHGKERSSGQMDGPCCFYSTPRETPCTSQGNYVHVHVGTHIQDNCYNPRCAFTFRLRINNTSDNSSSYVATCT